MAADTRGEIESEHNGDAPRAGPILVLWMILTFGLQASLWITGAKTTSLSDAIEAGAAKTESRAVGEVGDEVVRKAIALQHDTKTFWTVLALFGDFVVEPISLPLRAGVVSVLFAGVALLRGRKFEFASGFAACAWAQGFWVLGLAVRAALAIGLKRAEIETSPVLLFSSGTIHGALLVGLRQLDVFALLGWIVMIRAGVVNIRAGLGWAILITLVLFLIEAVFRVQFSLLVEAGMRLTLMPET